LTGLWDRASRENWRLENTRGSIVLALLLASEVASLVTEVGILYFASILVAWLVLPAIVGFRNILDAGCVFMLVSLGIAVVVDAAGQGRIPLLT
jgi:hypothetical protein